MARLEKDLVVDEEKFDKAAADMRNLKKRTNDLKTDLEKMYDDLATAMDTPSGEALQLEAKEVLLKPVENMALVIGHISETLDLIIGSGYYKDVFTGFENLSNLF